MSRTVGIDLGTTYSAVAVMNDADQPQILTNREGELLTPSVVLFQDAGPTVGTMAKRSARTVPYDVVEFVKRYMGDPNWRYDGPDGQVYRPEDISAFVLKRLKEDAQQALGEQVERAVITVPAYFDDVQRQATRDAGTIAGLDVVRVVNEPTAAALAHGLSSGFEGTALVYDLGGGTFDVTILTVHGGHFEVLATDGDRNLGGFDWDNRLMRLLNDRYHDEGGPDLLSDDAWEADLRELSVQAKHDLSTNDTTTVDLLASGVPRSVEVSRAAFEHATSSLLSRTLDVAELTREAAGVAWRDIDRILLVGGSTRMPVVRSAVESLAGRRADSDIHPDYAVALGAAVLARLVDAETGIGAPPAMNSEPVTVVDVTRHGMGTLAIDPESGLMQNTVIIAPNTRVPARGSEFFSTVDHNQEVAEIRVTVGDEVDPAQVRLVTRETPILVRLLPHPAGAPLRVSYMYDVDLCLQVEVEDLVAGQSLGSFPVRDVWNLSRQQVAAAATRMRSIEVV